MISFAPRTACRTAIPLLILACIFAPVLLGAGTPPAPSTPAQGPAEISQQQGAPVVFDGETLWYVHESIGVFTPEERAQRIENRLRLMAEDPFYSPDLFSIKEEKDRSFVYYKDETIGVITWQDVEKMGKSPAEISAEYIQKVRDAIARYQEKRLPAARVRAEISVGIATILLVALFFYIRRLRQWLDAIIERRRKAGLGIPLYRNLRLSPAEGQRVLSWFCWLGPYR